MANAMCARSMLRVAIALLLLSVMAALVVGHGSMVGARGTLNTNSIKVPKCNLRNMPADNCPHCLNGGGKGAVTLAAGGNWRVYEPLNSKAPFRRDAALCGDAILDSAPRPHERGGRFGTPSDMPFSAVYNTEQEVEFVVDVTTNHNGFFEFFICDVSKCGGDLTEKCFTAGHCHQLMRVKTPACESQRSKECGPIDKNYPGRWYVPCRKGSHVGEHFMGGKYMKYKLPAAFTCKDCVVQWYWATANSCNPPGFKEYFDNYPMPGWGKCPGDGGAFGGRNPTLTTCGGSNFPEEFWGCSDVLVKGRNEPNPAKMPKCGKTALTPSEDDDDDEEEEEQDFEREVTPKKAQAPTPPPRIVQKQQKPQQRQTPQQKPPQQKPAVSGAKTAEDCVEKLEFRDDDETVPDLKNAKCASNWKQCGGTGFAGPKDCCTPSFECVRVNPYYAQCKVPRRSGPQRARR